MARHVGGRAVRRLSKASSSGIGVRVVILAGSMCALLVVEGLSLAVPRAWWAWIICCAAGGFAGLSRMRLEIHRRLIDLQWRHRGCEIDCSSPRDTMATSSVGCLNEEDRTDYRYFVQYLLGDSPSTTRQDTTSIRIDRNVQLLFSLWTSGQGWNIDPITCHPPRYPQKL